MTIRPTAFPASRPRRLRRDDFTRRLVREHALSVNDLIYPVFVLEGQGRREAVGSMPGVERLSLDLLLPVAERCVALGIPVMALFPVIDPSRKTEDGREAFNEKGLVPQVVRSLKQHFPPLPFSMSNSLASLYPVLCMVFTWPTLNNSATSNTAFLPGSSSSNQRITSSNDDTNSKLCLIAFTAD